MRRLDDQRHPPCLYVLDVLEREQRLDPSLEERIDIDRRAFLDELVEGLVEPALQRPLDVSGSGAEPGSSEQVRRGSAVPLASAG
jgi:hypothetical protein